ncbi:PepSY domain-containing protein [Solibacillus sp. A46]|uniref:PepSY domain-containing protein n=1 Tax=Solibacillus faecavium TaxID=2762221 RepID=A0ABR8XWW5_9BACL|nr:YcdB/YcdC domain-containing protein [Solibacillus faecavium]MBD8036383.1 PepSY domain-containing protein [Solibacillus faecavium]
MKKWTTALSMSIVSLGLLASPGITEASVGTQEERVPIYVAVTDEQVTKEQLIQILKTKLPEMFSTYSNNDFQMSSMSHHYADDLTIRYELMFNKKVNKQTEGGSVTFKGDNLEIEHFYFNPANLKDALFPGKITEDQARKIAEDFVKKVSASGNYSLSNNVPSYYYGSRLITEPITYSFSFTPNENNIPIPDQSMMVSVLGDGKIQSFYQNSMPKRMSFEESKNIISKEAAINKMKEQLNLSLQYTIEYLPYSSKPSVKLVYLPAPNVIGLHATSNQWATYSGKVDSLQSNATLQPLAPNQLKTPSPITLEEAKAIAKQLVDQQENTTKFTIDHAYEYESNDQAVISVSYSYRYRNGSHGSSIEFNKNTGELVSYSDFFGPIPFDEEEAPKNTTPKLSKEKVMELAEKYVKELAPTTVHEYAKANTDPSYDKESQVHHVSFPRIKNGLIVNGDNVSVAIDDEGKLKSFYRYPLNIEEWPSAEAKISNDEAKKIFTEALDVKLVYNRLQNEDGKYELVYFPTVKGQEYYQLDANSGQIINQYEQLEKEKVSHPTAERELNYLIQAGAIEVKDAKTFNADVAITQGQALNMITKSITYFYEDYYMYRQEQPPVSFEQIDADHPYYKVVENATRIGILNPNEDELNIDQKVTNEQLAVWFIRTLGLEQAAKHRDIYQLPIKDAADVDPDKIGYVALSNALGLQKSDQSMFLPKKEVTYAELSKSIIQLAYEIAEKRNSGMYYY